MAKLPKIEVKAHWARDELHKGKAHRDKALAFLADAGDGPLARELREAVKKRGRQPFGAKYRWWEIGIDNDELTEHGMGREARLAKLGADYMLHPRQVEDALAKYNEAVEEIRAVNAENGDS